MKPVKFRVNLKLTNLKTDRFIVTYFVFLCGKRKLMRHIDTFILFALLAFLFHGCRRMSSVGIEALPYQAMNNGGWGLIATDGTVRIPAGTFTSRPSAVVNGMFTLPVSDDESMLFDIAHPEQPVSQRRFARVGYFADESVTIAQETTESPILIIDRKGKTLNDIGIALHYDIVCVHNFQEGRALFITRKGKYGFMDTKGEIVIPPIYDQAFDFHEGRALVGNVNGQGEMSYQCISPSGGVILQIQASPYLLDKAFSDELLMYSNSITGRYGYMGYDGETVIYLPDSIRVAYPFWNGVATVQTDHGMGLMNMEGEWLIEPVYDNLVISGKDRVSACTNGEWQLLDFNKEKLGDAFTAALYFYDSGQAVARWDDHTYGWIDRDGREVNGQRYAYIHEDPFAIGSSIQMLVRQEQPTKLEISQEEKKEEDVSSETPLAGKVEAAESASSSTILSGEEWKNIGKQNPFYSEASKILAGKLPEEDAENRRMILNYVEHLRTSYTTKDIDFLTQLFSENALIIVGKVIRNAPQIDGQFLPREKVEYNIKSKQAYLERLKTLFRMNKKIELQFSDFKIMKHPTQKGLYGVSLRQKYHSDLYSDDGYLFLLWDFRDETMPLIHIRTWQPAMLDDRTPLPEREIFSINNFNLQ